jgi:hypothetical protein
MNNERFFSKIEKKQNERIKIEKKQVEDEMNIIHKAFESR